MTRLKSRVRRLERQRGPCPICHGKGRWIFAVLGDTPRPNAETQGEHVAGSLEEADAMPGCPGCGLKNVIVLRYVKVSGIARLGSWREEAATA
jgi:hypothetical protein